MLRPRLQHRLPLPSRAPSQRAATSGSKQLQIGDVRFNRRVPSPGHSSLNYLHHFVVPGHGAQKNRVMPWALAHLRWMAQKDNLGQDMLLVGPPGPLRRRMAMAYCELAG
jgi:hypothetical protein